MLACTANAAMNADVHPPARQCPHSRSLTPGLAAALIGDGFALADIAVADGKIIAHRRAGRQRRCRPAPSILPAASSCRPSSTATPISTRAISGRASPTPTAPSWARSSRPAPTVPRAGAREDVAAAWISRCAAPTRTAPRRCAPISISAAAGDDSWPVFEEMRETLARPHRTAGRVPVRHRRRARRRVVRQAGASGSRRQGACSARVTYMVPDLERTARPCLRAGDRAGLDLDFHADETDDVARHLAEEDRRGGTVERLRGQDPRRPLLLAGAAARSRGAGHAGQGGEGRYGGGVAADVQSLSAGPARRTRPRRAGAA